jgi:hypothetical protein
MQNFTGSVQHIDTHQLLLLLLLMLLLLLLLLLFVS